MKYKINAHISEEGPGEPFIDGFRDGNGLPADGLEAIFPIVQAKENNPFFPVGTGFFISNNGLFATAKHVLIENNTKKPYESLAGIQIIRNQNKINIRDVIKISFHPTADVAIGFLIDKEFIETGKQTINKGLVLTNRIPAIGEKVAIFAFYEPRHFSNEDYFNNEFKIHGNNGIIEEYFPNGRDKVFLPNKCFQTNMESKGGASGGPVALSTGEIFGINSTGIDGASISYISSIQDIFDLQLRLY